VDCRTAGWPSPQFRHTRHPTPLRMVPTSVSDIDQPTRNYTRSHCSQQGPSDIVSDRLLGNAMRSIPCILRHDTTMYSMRAIHLGSYSLQSRTICPSPLPSSRRAPPTGTRRSSGRLPLTSRERIVAKEHSLQSALMDDGTYQLPSNATKGRMLTGWLSLDPGPPLSVALYLDLSDCLRW